MRDIGSDLIVIVACFLPCFLLGVVIGMIIIVSNASIDIEKAVRDGNTLQTEFYKESEGSTSYEKYSEWLESKIKKG